MSISRMWQRSWSTYLIISYALVRAQFPPRPENLSIIKSRFNNSVTISYKEPKICETTPGVKSYAGYINFPPGILEDLAVEQNYSTSTFFYFFESRKDSANAPLALWFNGGPGSSSLIGLMSENGPCIVGPDSNTTTVNPWSWNNEVNMLYIDQPTQVGMSYDILTNATLNALTGMVSPFIDGTVPTANMTYRIGTFSSQDPNRSINGTLNSARSIWHFLQTWLQEFPAYRPNDNAINIFTESYGGRYGPSFSAYFEAQNEQILKGNISSEGERFVIKLGTLGLINSCIDAKTQVPFSPEFAFRGNTYGIEAINETAYHQALENLHRPETGCLAQLEKCQLAARFGDSEFYGSNGTVNQICATATEYCEEGVESYYQNSTSRRNFYDIGMVDPDPSPTNYFNGWLNNDWVQRALGVPVNWTMSNIAVYSAFYATGDYGRSDTTIGPDILSNFAYLLDRGVRISLIYGDRDYACNWLGGEAVSLAINHTQADAFRKAGYQNITINDTYVGGAVREHGNFSFARVYDAGHTVPSYQPETAYRIFQRAIFGKDIASGTINLTSSYTSTGPSDSLGHRNSEPPKPKPECYLWAISETCSKDEIKLLRSGSSVRVQNYVLLGATNATSNQLGFKSTPAAPSVSGAAAISKMDLTWLVIPAINMIIAML